MVLHEEKGVLGWVQHGLQPGAVFVAAYLLPSEQICTSFIDHRCAWLNAICLPQ